MRDLPVLVVDWQADEPVYAQVARQIRSRIVSGGLAPGSLLPPVRALASDLGVNLNTVARAYWQLEAEGFLRIRSRAGAEVLAPPSGRPDPGTSERLREELAAVLARLWQAGIGTADIRHLVERELARMTIRR